ncbi:AtpZ/AtpI family protein [Poriferisphaera sp. WC338]|uniref:AtpZ/AtpI family protein n=1 Tax=Poriferisphaera sp. WC338 TaxID=3425129 RepID=UPI003D817360
MSKGGQPNPWRHFHMGLEFAGAAALMTIIGYVIDKKYGTAPWGVLICGTIGFVGGLYLFIKEALLANKQSMQRMSGLTGKPSLYRDREPADGDKAEVEHPQELGRASSDDSKEVEDDQGGGKKEAGGGGEGETGDASSEYEAKLAEWLKQEQQEADRLSEDEGEDDEADHEEERG